MGSLTPGVNYTYEREGGVVYSREEGITERKIVGYDYDPNTLRDLKELSDQVIWKEIFEEAKGNKSVQDALDRVKIVYYLSKGIEPPTKWHPV